MRADVVLALVCCTLGQIEVAAIGSNPVRVLSAALVTLPIAVRQRAPLAATVAVAASWAIFHLWSGAVGEPFFFFAALPVFYSLGAHPRLGRAVAGAATLLVIVAVTTPQNFTFLALQFALTWLSARSARTYRLQSGQLRKLATRLEAQREASEKLAVAQERQRMAGELHDTIAHAVSSMVIQAGGAEQMMNHHPDRARDALIAIQDSGRQVIVELQRVLHLLRGTPDTPTIETAPAPVIPPSRWRRQIPHSALGELVLAMGLVLASDPRLIFNDPIIETRMTIAASIVIACLAIAIRRRYPVTALMTAAATTAAELLLIGQSMGLAPVVAALVAMYSVAAHTSTRRAVSAAATAVLAIGIPVLVEVGPDSMLLATVWLAIPWFGGRSVRSYRRQAEQLRTLTARLSRETDARTRLAVIGERARVARDMHDSVAHAVSVMVLQAGAAEQVMATLPDSARSAIHAIEAQGRRAHGDLRQMLGLLDNDDSTPRAPQPSLARLDTLLAEVARAGLPIVLHVHGRPAALPAGLDISAYRIVQEGLTNTLKHAGPVHTTVTLDYESDALAIEIHDPGTREAPLPASHGGHGLVGMRERVTLYGGTLETGPCAGGGYAIRARLPLELAPT